MAAKEYTTLDVDGCELRSTSPSKVYVPPTTGARRSRSSTADAGHLDLARGDADNGLGDAPRPPNVAMQPGEPIRARPSRCNQDERR